MLVPVLRREFGREYGGVAFVEHRNKYGVKGDLNLAPEPRHDLAVRSHCGIVGSFATLFAGPGRLLKTFEPLPFGAVSQKVSFLIKTTDDVMAVAPGLVLGLMRQRPAMSLPCGIFTDWESLLA
jgi:hypothetical protein